MTKYKITEIREENYILDEKDVYNNIYDLIDNNNEEDLSEIINLTQGKIKLDFSSYEEGLLGILAIRKGNPKILKLLCESDNNLVSQHGTEMLVDAIMYNKTECAKYLIKDQNVNTSVLDDTDVYNSFKKIELLIDDHAENNLDQSQALQVMGAPQVNYHAEVH